MGDKVNPPASGAGQDDTKAHSITGAEGNTPIPENIQTATDGSSVPHHSQPQSAPNQHGFSSQFDMIPSPPPSTNRQGPYNMVPMVNALPQAGYRHGHYPQGVQQRYPSTPSPVVMHQMQFANPSMPMPNQDYYVQQPHMAPYYNAGQLSSTQAQSNISSRPPMAYYPNQMMMNHPTPGYYYPPTPQYHTQPQHISTNIIPSQYMVGNPTSPDARALHRASDADSISLQQRSQTSSRTMKYHHYPLQLILTP